MCLEHSRETVAMMQMASKEAKDLGYPVDTMFIILGLLLSDPKNIISRHILEDCKISAGKFRKSIERINGDERESSSESSGSRKKKKPPFPWRKKNTQTEFSSDTKKAFEDAKKLKRRYKQKQVTPELYFLAFFECNEGEYPGITLLRKLGVDPEELKTKTLKTMATEISNQPENTSEAPETLIKFGVDLTEKARRGKLDPIFGRSKELDRIIHVLSKRTKNNPLLVGEPGVGKTAVVEGLALRMVEGDVPTRFKSTTIFSLDLAQLVAGTQFRGQFESRLTSMIDTVKEGEKDIILFVDEIHMLLGAGAVEGGMDAANILKPALSRGEIQCIGATTEKEYTKYIEADAAFDRRFQKIEIVQPSITNTIEIMEGLRDLYEEYHGVEISNDALRTTVELADRYLPEQFLPDKAINLIDDACVSAKEEYGDSGTPILQEFRVELEETIQKKKKAIQNNKFEIAQECRNSEVNLKIQIKAILGLENEDKSADIIVTEEHVAKALSEMTRIPVAKLTKTESEKLLQMEKVLHSRVVGQDEAVVTIAKAMRRARVGINNPTRPIASLMFCGPTGVGKTELTKALATHFFDSEDALVRLDMSEYMEAHTVSKLIGSPPGFVGFDQGGQLTEKVRKNPYCVVLFDEIEKAHPEIFNLMLQIFDDGRLTDSQGRTVRFNESIIILTSNVGAGAIQELQSDFTKATYTGKSLYEQLKDKVLEKLKETFRPEFINRLDDIIVFKRLTKYQIEEIAAISLKQIRKRLLTGKNIFLEFTRKFKNKLLDEGYDPVYGARPLRRAVTKLLVDPLAESYLNEKIKDGQHVLVNFDGQKTIFNADLFLWPEEGDWRWNRI